MKSKYFDLVFATAKSHSLSQKLIESVPVEVDVEATIAENGRIAMEFNPESLKVTASNVFTNVPPIKGDEASTEALNMLAIGKFLIMHSEATLVSLQAEIMSAVLEDMVAKGNIAEPEGVISDGLWGVLGMHASLVMEAKLLASASESEPETSEGQTLQ